MLYLLMYLSLRLSFCLSSFLSFCFSPFFPLLSSLFFLLPSLFLLLSSCFFLLSPVFCRLSSFFFPLSPFLFPLFFFLPSSFLTEVHCRRVLEEGGRTNTRKFLRPGMRVHLNPQNTFEMNRSQKKRPYKCSCALFWRGGVTPESRGIVKISILIGEDAIFWWGG